MSRIYEFKDLRTWSIVLYHGNWDTSFSTSNLTSTFEFDLVQPVALYPYLKPDNDDDKNQTLVQQVTSVRCAPAYATYTLNTSYSQGVRTLSYSTEYRDLLSIPLDDDPALEFEDCFRGNDSKPGCDPEILPMIWPANTLVRN